MPKEEPRLAQPGPLAKTTTTVNADDSVRGRQAAIFAWTCAVCDEPVEDGTGHVEIRSADIAAAKSAWAAYRARNTGNVFVPTAELLDIPEVHWRAVHLACDDDSDGEFYAFAVERIRRPGQALDWAAHLAEKPWIELTDWPSVLRSLSRQIGGEL